MVINFFKKQILKHIRVEWGFSEDEQTQEVHIIFCDKIIAKATWSVILEYWQIK